MKTVLVAYGTRPEAIKVAPLVLALQHSTDISVVPVSTGQHRDMLVPVHETFGFAPAIDLDLMRHRASLSEMGARTLDAMATTLESVEPDAVVVQGDTHTAFFSGLAAFYARRPLVHLEAGLRTGDLHAPFPEEANRRLLAPLADLHLAPTPAARRNLLAEGIDEDDIVVTGNTVIDALHLALADPASPAENRLAEVLRGDGRLLLVTAHRRESWGEPMRHIAEAVRLIATTHPELAIVVPMHRNPGVRETLIPVLSVCPNVILTEPLGYADFAQVMARAHLILTDSGGVQEEAPSLGVPVLVLREATERPEAVHAGTVRLVGTDTGGIARESLRILEDDHLHAQIAAATNPYGDGRATLRAVAAVRQMLGLGARLPDFVPAPAAERAVA